MSDLGGHSSDEEEGGLPSTHHRVYLEYDLKNIDNNNPLYVEALKRKQHQNRYLDYTTPVDVRVGIPTWMFGGSSVEYAKWLQRNGFAIRSSDIDQYSETHKGLYATNNGQLLGAVMYVSADVNPHAQIKAEIYIAFLVADAKHKGRGVEGLLVQAIEFLHGSKDGPIKIRVIPQKLKDIELYESIGFVNPPGYKAWEKIAPIDNRDTARLEAALQFEPAPEGVFPPNEEEDLPKGHDRIMVENSLKVNKNNNSPAYLRSIADKTRQLRYLDYPHPVDVRARVPLWLFSRGAAGYAQWLRDNSKLMLSGEDIFKSVAPHMNLYAVSHGELLGVASCATDVKGADIYILFIVIDKKHRGRGVGNLLLQAIEFVSESKDGSIRIRVKLDTEEDIAFYESAGYKMVSLGHWGKDIPKQIGDVPHFDVV